MLQAGPAKKVTVYVNEDSRHGALPLYEAVLEHLLHHGVSGATASKAAAGFGAHHRMHTPKIELAAEHLPVRIEFVESAAKVNEVMAALIALVGDGLIEVQDTTVVKDATAGTSTPSPKRTRVQGPAQMLRVFFGEADTFGGMPLYRAIVDCLRAFELGGVTVSRGILGYGAKGHTHRQGLLHFSRDLPVVVTAVDTPERIARAAAGIEEMMGDGLIVISDVQMTRLEECPPHA